MSQHLRIVRDSEAHAKVTILKFSFNEQPVHLHLHQKRVYVHYEGIAELLLHVEPAEPHVRNLCARVEMTRPDGTLFEVANMNDIQLDDYLQIPMASIFPDQVGVRSMNIRVFERGREEFALDTFDIEFVR